MQKESDPIEMTGPHGPKGMIDTEEIIQMTTAQNIRAETRLLLALVLLELL